MIDQLATLGLSLDLVGVVILGLDVLALQKAAQKAAVNSRNLLEYHRDALTLNVGWHEWRTGGVSEGLFEADGGIDAGAAQQEFRELTEFSLHLDDRVSTMVQLLDEATAAQENSASRSLKLTGIGLTLITVGFAMQIASQFISGAAP